MRFIGVENLIMDEPIMLSKKMELFGSGNTMEGFQMKQSLFADTP